MKGISTILIALLFFSCAKGSEKKILGSWIAESVKIQDGAGFIYYDSVLEPNKNNLWFSEDSMHANLEFEFMPLGSNFYVADSLKIATKWEKTEDLIMLENQNYSLKIEFNSNKQLVFSYYDNSNYRLKTFFLRKN
ncbi:MAG: hypothetical protein FJY17_06625 [Bacteroidetes bacterium]|nr:hypothetical protein [Bacteroidota bacterium]